MSASRMLHIAFYFYVVAFGWWTAAAIFSRGSHRWIPISLAFAWLVLAISTGAQIWKSRK